MLNSNLIDKVVDLSDVDKSQWKSYFGKGYDAVCYEVDPETHAGQIILFGYDLDGNRAVFRMPWECHIWYRVMFDTGIKDMYGHWIKERTFKTTSERKRYVDGSAGLHIVECLKPESEFLHWAFDDVVLDPDFNNQKRRIFFLDIETEISDHFVGGNEASNRINMITIYDTETEKFYTWSLQKVSKHLDESKYVLFDDFRNNESKMLIHFVNWWQKNYPSVVASWNGQAFDIPYIIRRYENTLGEDYAKRFSPVGKYRIREVNHDNERANQDAEIEVEIFGIFGADELRLYRDKFMIAPALDGGYNLSNVGEHENLGKKLEYQGTLKDLYEKDYQRFYEYNVRDVDLLVKIEEKCKLIPLAIRVCGAGLVNYEGIYASIGYLIGSLIAFAKTEMKVVFQSYMKERKETQSYEGAYVFPSVVGVYKGGIATCDFNSLYPSTIRANNLSPETYVGKIGLDGVSNTDEPIDLTKDIRDFYLIRRPGNKKVESISRKDLLDAIEKRCIYTRNNTLFVKHSVKQGVVSAWCKHFYGLRKSTKKEMQRLDLALYNKEIPEDKIEETKIQVQNLDAIQHAVKIMLNSVYGILGTGHSPIGDPEIAQTITRQGRWCNQSAARFVDRTFKQIFKRTDPIADNKDLGIGCVASGDTDSIFLTIDYVTDWMRDKYSLPKRLNDWSDEMKLKLWDFMQKFIEEKVNGFVQNMVREYTHTEHPEVLRYSLEYIGDCGIYETKKHYAVHKIVSEGPEIVDKVKTTGIELKKATIPLAVKDVLKDIYYGVLLHEWTNDDFNKYLLEAYEKFLKLSIDDVSIWKGWSSDKISSTGFLQTGKGMTGISKACHYYNDLINHMGIGKKYDELRTGGKYKFVYLNPNNAYGIDCLAYVDGQWPKEFEGIFVVDYQLMFEKLIKDPLRSFLEATGFVFKDPRERELCELDEL